MKFHTLMEMPDILQLVGAVLDSGPPDDTVNLVTFGEQHIGKI